MIKLTLNKSDIFGAVASTLCVIHCLATPFIFIAQAGSLAGSETSPFWWRNLDYIFLFISFLAVYQSTKNTSKSFMEAALWLCWTALFIAIINEKIQWFSLPEIITYITALILAVLHIYNLKYCQCKTNNCCI